MGKFRLVVFDMDGVLVDAGSSWVVVHDHFGVNNMVSLQAYLNHEIDDLEFMRRDIVLWKEKEPGIGIAQIEQILGKVPLMPGVKEVFSELENAGIQAVIVSGGIDVLAKRVCQEAGCKVQISNGLEVDGERKLTGEGVLRVPVLHKDEVVRRLQEKYGADRDETAAVGNSHVDTQMFKEAGLSIAFDPEDEETREKADVVIEEKDLRLILPLIIQS